ncbi:MAG: M1 family metallopeptidase [Chitinophagales bacterium]|nr:M1 family metallopeptidase [Chitinophagales bacterium]
MRILYLFALLMLPLISQANCDPELMEVNSPRNSKYIIEATLDNENKMLQADQFLQWVNHSSDTVFSIHFSMYTNAFRNSQSTFMLSTEGNLFGNSLKDRPEEDWGWLDVSSAKRNGIELIDKASYIHPDDDNEEDKTVLEIVLDTPLNPGDTLQLEMKWEQKIPKLFSRLGYQRQEFYNMVHWFPKMGVWEKDREGKWGWNCHQAHRRTEFYGDFAIYDVSITLPDHLIFGASGCKVNETDLGDGRKTIRHIGKDIISFAWCAYPYFHVVEDQWEHVYIRLLIPPEHCHHRHRIIATVKHSLKYLSDKVGLYPYNSITIMDPPLHALNSGFMEYPTYITGGSFAIFPKGMHSMESLIAHEFAHQYFMAIIATNEKEEPWLDEGFTTYHEDKIMESMYGLNGSLFRILGYKVNNSSFSRHEYVALPNPSTGSVARSGWQIKEGYKGIIYSKTATILKTMEGMMGEELFVDMMRGYYQKYKFAHPRGEDFIDHVKSFLATSSNKDALGDVDLFFEQLIYGTDKLDYQATEITYFTPIHKVGFFGTNKDYVEEESTDTIVSKALVHRLGAVVLPVDVRFTFENGDVINTKWSGKERAKFFYLKNTSRLTTIEIDPENKLYIDIDLNNNSLSLKSGKSPSIKIASKVMYFIHNIIQTLGILI